MVCPEHELISLRSNQADIKAGRQTIRLNRTYLPAIKFVVQVDFHDTTVHRCTVTRRCSTGYSIVPVPRQLYTERGGYFAVSSAIRQLVTLTGCEYKQDNTCH